jgi:hypothetical protein
MSGYAFLVIQQNAQDAVPARLPASNGTICPLKRQNFSAVPNIRILRSLGHNTEPRGIFSRGHVQPREAGMDSAQEVLSLR